MLRRKVMAKTSISEHKNEQKPELKLVQNSIVQIRNLTKDFDSVRALDDVSLDIPEGHIIGLLGPNGSGKSTLLKVLAGFYGNYSGEVLIDGQRPGGHTKAKVAYLPDKSGIPADMTVRETVKIYRTFFDDFDEEKCMRLLEEFKLKLQQMPKEMSKGMVDKLQIALTMSREARLYLLDEPIGGVDVEARERILDLIIENFNPRGSMLIVTHLIRDIERIFDSVIVLQKGRLQAVGDADSFRLEYGKPLDEVLKEMLGNDEKGEFDK